MKLTWITFENNDSRHPSYKRNKGSESSSYDDIDVDHAQPPAKIQETDMLDVDQDYEMLFRNNQSEDHHHHHHHHHEEEEDEDEDENCRSLALIRENKTLSSTIPGSDRADITTLNTITHNGNVKVDLPQFFDYHKRFSTFFRTFPEETYNVFKNKETENLFAHYLLVTCVSLDPLNGSGPTNISEKFFVPFAVYNPSTLHGILSMSSSQLSITNPEYKSLALIHKSLSYKHLYALLKDKDQAISMSAICAIITHLSIEIIESNSQNWQFHVRALRKIVMERERRGVYNDQFAKLMYIRIARYDCFACISTGDVPLFEDFKVEDHQELDPLVKNLDGVFGCPAAILFFCAKLSSLSKKRYDLLENNNTDLTSEEVSRLAGIDEDELLKKLNSLLDVTSSTVTTEEWRLNEELWKFALVVHFNFCIRDDFQYNAEENYEITRKFLGVLKLLLMHHEDGFFCSNLLFPIITVASIVEEKRQEERGEFLHATDIFYKRTNIGAFNRAKDVVKSIWNLKAKDEYSKPSSWWKYRKVMHWDIYLA